MRVPDVGAATAWYTDVLGFTVLSPPYRMEGPGIEQDMGELVPPPAVVKASIVGLGRDGRASELIEYPGAGTTGDPYPTRGSGCHLLTSATADVARLRTTWFSDPWGTVFILIEMGDTGHPCSGQFGSSE